jgi:SAM-dependent methyltransferase
MDLREKMMGYDGRHPWEVSRIVALKDILVNDLPPGRQLTVLDVGCGDGFVSRELNKMGRFRSITAVDTYLSVRQVAEMSSQCAEITFCNDYGLLQERHYDLILMLDVIEHVQDDEAFVFDIVKKYMASEGRMLITAPAFQFLYGSHDEFLKHFRRYSRKTLLGILAGNDLECISSGYLFISLLPIRFLFVLVEKIFHLRRDVERGVGAWRGGRMITRICERLLALDNRCAIYLSRRGLTIPGLTVWALCRKRRS